MSPQSIIKLKTIIVEIKPKKQTMEPIIGKKHKRTVLNETLTYEINKAKWQSAIKFCDKNNIKFTILTEEELF